MKNTRLTVSFFISALLVGIAQADPIHDLINQGQRAVSEGYYREAKIQFTQAHELATANKDDYHRLVSQSLLGHIAIQQQQFELAEQLLTEALQAIPGEVWPELRARLALYLGKLHQRLNHVGLAEAYLHRAASTSKLAQAWLLAVSSDIHLAQLFIDQGDQQLAWQHLKQAHEVLKGFTEPADTPELWLNLGYQAQQLTADQQVPEQLELAYAALSRARQLAEKNQQTSTEILALTYLGGLYEDHNKPQAALQLTIRAINLAQRHNNHDLLIDLEWRLGRLYSQQNQINEAISAYRRAVSHIEAIRIDLPITYKDGRSSFRETLAPVYTGLADLLLRQARQSSLDQAQVILKEARDTIETFKRGELQDYLQSRCEIASQPIALNEQFPKTAALYPILLPDRLEIIIYSEAGLKQFTSPIDAKQITGEAKIFASLLRSQGDESQIDKLSSQFYDWLIRPAAKYLQQNSIDTLLYIPDGVLRLIPLAALNDGNQYLVENYAIATLPGMSLTEASTVSQSQADMFFVGLSKPGEVVKELPEALLANLINYLEITKKTVKSTVASRDIVRFVGSGDEVSDQQDKQQNKIKLRGLLQNPEIVEGLQELLSLPGVEQEINQLATNNSPRLLNEEFSLKGFTQAIEQQSFRVIHIASHGFFGGTADQSFIMTHDRVLTMNNLENLLSTQQFSQNPPELVTFSACQTAEGNDRSPLGISGVALKANVGSVLGSLWPISDAATVPFMNDFYGALQNAGQSKAKALQQAQINLMKIDKFKSPSIWSPYILVGNWI